MSCHYAVRLNPDSLRDYDDEIKIQIQSREPIIVPLLGRCPPPKLTKPSVVDVGQCLVGGCHVVQYIVKNEGGHGRFCVTPNTSWPTANLSQLYIMGMFRYHHLMFTLVLEIGAGLMEIFFPTSISEELCC